MDDQQRFRAFLQRLCAPCTRADPGQPSAPPRFALRKVHRQEEFVAVAGPVQLLHEWESSDATVTASLVAEFSKLFQESGGLVVSYARLQHKVGELAHYFDGVWVLTGARVDERLVCYRLGASPDFIALHYCAGPEGKNVYNQTLSNLEAQWYAAGRTVNV